MVRFSNEGWFPQLERQWQDFPQIRADGITAPNRWGGWGYILSVWWQTLQLRLHYQQYDAAQEMAAGFVADAKEYFFGEWREQELKAHGLGEPDPSWIVTLADGLVCALLIDDWASCRQLARFIDSPEVRYARWVDNELNDDMIDHHRGLCQLILSRRFTLTRDSSFRSRKVTERTRLLRECLLTLAERDTAAFTTALANYVIYYRKREWKKGDLGADLCSAGSLLYHLGQRLLKVPINLERHLDAKHWEMIARIPDHARVDPQEKQPAGRRKKCSPQEGTGSNEAQRRSQSEGLNVGDATDGTWWNRPMAPSDCDEPPGRP